MKIAFNIDYDHAKPTGIGRYGIELIKSWNKIDQEVNCGYQEIQKANQWFSKNFNQNQDIIPSQEK